MHTILSSELLASRERERKKKTTHLLLFVDDILGLDMVPDADIGSP